MSSTKKTAAKKGNKAARVDPIPGAELQEAVLGEPASKKRKDDGKSVSPNKRAVRNRPVSLYSKTTRTSSGSKAAQSAKDEESTEMGEFGNGAGPGGPAFADTMATATKRDQLVAFCRDRENVISTIGSEIKGTPNHLSEVTAESIVEAGKRRNIIVDAELAESVADLTLKDSPTADQLHFFLM